MRRVLVNQFSKTQHISANNGVNLEFYNDNDLINTFFYGGNIKISIIEKQSFLKIIMTNNELNNIDCLLHNALFINKKSKDNLVINIF